MLSEPWFQETYHQTGSMSCCGRFRSLFSITLYLILYYFDLMTKVKMKSSLRFLTTSKLLLICCIFYFFISFQMHWRYVMAKKYFPPAFILWKLFMSGFKWNLSVWNENVLRLKLYSPFLEIFIKWIKQY